MSSTYPASIAHTQKGHAPQKSVALEKSPRFATLLQMLRKLALALLLLLPLLALATDQHRLHRSTAARRAFRREHPCPATRQTTGPCPGYVVDHIRALACDGEDAPRNMRWQTREDAKEKDRTERKDCGR